MHVEEVSCPIETWICILKRPSRIISSILSCPRRACAREYVCFTENIDLPAWRHVRD